MSKVLLLTGSSILIGSEVCTYLSRELVYTIHGADKEQVSFDRSASDPSAVPAE